MKGNVRIFAYDVNSKIQNSPKVSLEQGFCVRRADVQIWSFVLLMNFSANIPPLRKAQNRQAVKKVIFF